MPTPVHTPPAIAPALSFLAAHNPAAAASLNSEFPFLAQFPLPAAASADKESPSFESGPPSAVSDDIRKEYEEQAVRKLYEKTLVTSLAVSEKKMLSIKKNLTREKRGKIASEGLRHLTTASFVGILASDKEIIEMISAIVGLISASILIVNQYNNVTIFDGKDLSSMYKD